MSFQFYKFSEKNQGYFNKYKENKNKYKRIFFSIWPYESQKTKTFHIRTCWFMVQRILIRQTFCKTKHQQIPLENKCKSTIFQRHVCMKVSGFIDKFIRDPYQKQQQREQKKTK